MQEWQIPILLYACWSWNLFVNMDLTWSVWRYLIELFRFGCCRTCTLMTTTYKFPNSVPDDKSATSDDSEVRQLRQSLVQCREDLSHEREASAHLRQLVTQREERDAQIQQHPIWAHDSMQRDDWSIYTAQWPTSFVDLCVATNYEFLLPTLSFVVEVTSWYREVQTF